ncbi:MAG: thioesterase family protein [Candidatus Methanoplasma sp.]|jgi:predicted thioesterase|nr:thioesterase family protein [Candidatus Methanoplasma sp.]
MIPVGITNEGKTMVSEKNTAARCCSGTLPVFSTPAMILLIERTASECLMPLLKDDESTVGTMLDIKHSAPSVVGSEVSCRVEVSEVDRSRVVFDVRVWDPAGEVGSGKHERFIVNSKRFMSRANERFGDR